LGYKPGYVENHVLVSNFDAILSAASADAGLEVAARALQDSETSGGFLCLGMGLSFHFPKLWRPPDSQKWHDINREKGEQQKGNNHAKNSKHQYLVQGNNRPQATVN
jgi:hypothetical protein